MAFLPQLAVQFRQRHRPGETARAFLERSGAVDPDANPSRGK
jgi:hypothetical protein